MTLKLSVDLDQYIKTALKELAVKQEALEKEIEKVGGAYYYWDSNERKIYWSKDEQSPPLIEYKLIPVGSYNAIKKTWLWAWANKNVSNHLELVRTFAKLAQMFPSDKILLDASDFNADAIFGQDMTAALNKLLGGKGMFRDGSPDDLAIYMILIDP